MPTQPQQQQQQQNATAAAAAATPTGRCGLIMRTTLAVRSVLLGAGLLGFGPCMGLAQPGSGLPSLNVFKRPLHSLLHRAQTLPPAAFAGCYVGCELLSIPPAPLAASAGVIYGLGPGTVVVVSSGVVAAAVSFQLSRRLLQQRFLKFAGNNPQFRFMDRAISKGGFKAVLLLRLLPTPLPCINYLYGLTNVAFWPYMLATLLGYCPGTLALVYSGVAGKQIFAPQPGASTPWRLYAAAALLFLAFLKLGASVAQELLHIDDETG